MHVIDVITQPYNASADSTLRWFLKKYATKFCNTITSLNIYCFLKFFCHHAQQTFAIALSLQTASHFT